MKDLLPFLRQAFFGAETLSPPEGFKARKFPQIHTLGQDWSPSLEEDIKQLMENNPRRRDKGEAERCVAYLTVYEAFCGVLSLYAFLPPIVIYFRSFF